MVELLLHHVLLVPDKAEEIDDVVRRARAAGIEVQLDKREQKGIEYGVVSQVGPTAFKDYGRGPDIVKAGDRVVFSKYAGKEIKQDNITYLLLNDEDVLAIIKD